jgi:hypothetical protein
MALPVINTRADLDAIQDTPEHAQFMALLAGTLWRLEKDEAIELWRATEDNSMIERFGFTNSDFPSAVAPELPVYVVPPSTIPQSITRRQARQALLLAGRLDLVQPAIDAISDATQRALMQIEWMDSQEFERSRPSLIAIGGAIGLDAAGIDALFVQAAAL